MQVAHTQTATVVTAEHDTVPFIVLTVIKEGVRMRMIKGLIVTLPATNRRCFLYLLVLSITFLIYVF